MAAAPLSSEEEVQKLKQFHHEHFPTQSTPSITLNPAHGAFNHEVHTTADETENLGSYADGVRRTLTDDQIAMFRNSEIQRLLSERRRQREQEEEREKELQAENEKSFADEQQADPKEEETKVSRPARSHRFADDLTEDVHSLMYDDNDGEPKDRTGSGQFQWPKLG